MTRVLRIDAGSLRKPTRTPHGFLRVDGIASRIGVFEYLNNDGSTRRELRLPEEVFRADALAGFEGAPLTDGHPPEMVRADNVKRYEVGTVTGPARRDGESVIASMVVKDPAMIAKLERGDTGLSVGYAIDFDESPGVHPQYGRYDGIQRNLVINHLAVGVVPRAGNSARVRMDGASVQLESKGTPMPNPTEQTDKQRADELEGQVKGLNTQIAELKALIAANATAAEGEALKAEKTRADAAEAKVARFDATFRTAVRERVKLECEAGAVMGSAFRMDDLDDRGIHAAVVKHIDASADVSATASDDMLRGQFRALIGKSAANAAAQVRMSEILGQTGQQAARADETEDAWEHYCKNSWKDTLKNGRVAAERR
jgi:hypothetical protein